MRVETTSGVMETFSDVAMYANRLAVELESSGVNRNLEQRDAKGSIILDKKYVSQLERVHG